MVKQLLSLFIISFYAFVGIAHAQSIERSVIGNAGEAVTKPGITLSYDVGEFVGDLLANPGMQLYLTTGFAQPDVDVQLANTNITLNLIAFPNPSTNGHIKLGFNTMPNGVYTIQVIDAIGHMLQTQTADYHNHNFYYIELDLSSLKGGMYFIRVTGDQGFHGDVKVVRL